MRIYYPEPVSRRGELIAWGSALLLNGVWVILVLAGQPVTLWIPVVAIPLTLVAFVMSLGNWMERHTRIEIDPEGIFYSNGLRRVRLHWEAIKDVRVLPSQWGQKTQVFGENVYFGFHSLGEVKANEKVIGRTGFAAGDLILEEILDRADMVAAHEVGDGNEQEGYDYYVRK